MAGPSRSHPDYKFLIGSSELGSCIKAQVARKLGYTALPTSERMHGLYDRGHEHEAECIEAMKADAWSFFTTQPEYVIDCGDGIGIIVHPDGIAQRSDSFYRNVVEIKSPSTWADFERAVRTESWSSPYMNQIRWQVSCQMVSTGHEAVVVCLSDTGLRYLVIEEPLVHRAELIARARLIAETDELPEACSQRDWPCAVAYLHEDEEYDTDPALDAAVAALESLRRDLARLKVMEASARKQVALVLGERDSVETLYSKVTKYTSNRTKLDTKAMEADGIDIAKYQTTTTTHAMRITAKDGQDATAESD